MSNETFYEITKLSNVGSRAPDYWFERGKNGFLKCFWSKFGHKNILISNSDDIENYPASEL